MKIVSRLPAVQRASVSSLSLTRFMDGLWGVSGAKKDILTEKPFLMSETIYGDGYHEEQYI